jgi:hypothetical protein
MMPLHLPEPELPTKRPLPLAADRPTENGHDTRGTDAAGHFAASGRSFFPRRLDRLRGSLDWSIQPISRFIVAKA